MDESTASYLNKDKPEEGISLLFTSLEKCQGDEFYSLQVDIKCNEKSETVIPKLDSDSV